MIGQTISHYKILEKLGEGGMGIVYKAQDLKLKRTVALKFLSSGVLAGDDEKARFIHEAQAAAALRHHGVCTVYEIDEADGRTFIVMEFIDGRNLKEILASGPMPLDTAGDLATQIAEVLKEAHDKGIVHRDVKPANIMVTGEGQVVLMDFGLARSSSATRVTKTGTTIGTVAYISPEQARGEDVDGRTDIWSLGAVLYEMITGQVPFKGDFEHAVIYSILNTEPKTPAEIRPDVPEPLERIVLKALEKDLDARYASAREVLADLCTFRAEGAPGFPTLTRSGPSLSYRTARIAIPVVAFVAIVIALFAWDMMQRRKSSWARQVALPELEELVEGEKYHEAYPLALQVKDVIPDDPTFRTLWAEATVEISMHTTPPGADVYTKPVQEPGIEWRHLGSTPIDRVAVPNGYFRWKIQKQGYETRETVARAVEDTVTFVLDVDGSIPDNMVRVPGGKRTSWMTGLGVYRTIAVSEFLMDRYEVSNRQFKEFVDGGGYDRPEFWKHEFVDGGEVLSWEAAMARFRDLTGRPGPATWELGAYPEGRGEYPVTGVSWYEAAAYAAFTGRDLPTVSHWLYAAPTHRGALILPLSNFGSEGLAPVGEYQGMSYDGTYDLAGNAREWCFNAVGENRFILGGCWSDPVYSFNFAESRSPWDRSPGNGFRSVEYLHDDSLLAGVREEIRSAPVRDYRDAEPVPDELFNAYTNLYFYDKTPLRAEVEFTDDTPEHWVIEKVAFDATYGNERVFAYLFLPKGVSPPYQTIALFPGAYAQDMRSSDDGRRLNSFDFVDFVVKAGRAVLCPVYKSTYERGDGYSFYNPETSMEAHQEHILMWWKDLSRSIDYLETRGDIDHDRIGYAGSSWGAMLAPLFLAQDRRYKVACLRLTGLWPWETNPAFDAFTFVTRVDLPILILNGRYDHIFPYETCQIPFYRYLGTLEDHKRLVVFETGHTTYGYRNEMIREVLAWLDRYLGPVERQTAHKK